MKKTFIFLIITAFNIGSLLANEFNWSKVVENKSGTSEFFLDNKSTRSIDGYNYQWLLINYLKDFEEVKSGVAYTTMDCKKNRMQEILWSEFSEYNGGGSILYHELIPQKDLEWQTAEPKTVMSILIKTSCDNISVSTNTDTTKKEKNKKGHKKEKSKYKEF